MKSVLNWHNDPIMKRFLRDEHMRATQAALDDLYKAGIIAICPGQTYKLTPAAQKEFRWYLM